MPTSAPGMPNVGRLARRANPVSRLQDQAKMNRLASTARPKTEAARRDGVKAAEKGNAAEVLAKHLSSEVKAEMPSFTDMTLGTAIMHSFLSEEQ